MVIAVGLVAALALPSLVKAQCSTADLDMNGVPDVCPAGSNYIEGTSSGETLRGTNGADCIFGLGGDDTIRGRGGDDYICAGGGADFVNSGAGNDRVFGEGGADELRGGPDNDFIDGGDGNDTLVGVGGDDTLNGGVGNDFIDGGAGADALSGQDGDDTLNGGGGNDSLSGGDGIDTLDGGGGTNTCVEEVPGTSDRLTNCDIVTYAGVGQFEVVQTAAGSVVTWDTTCEVGTVAFRIWRLQPDGGLAQVGEVSAAADGSPHGARYFLVDEDAPPEEALTYILEERTVSGGSVSYGPFVRIPRPAEPGDGFVEAEARSGRLANSVALKVTTPEPARLAKSAFAEKSNGPPSALILSVDQAGVVELTAEAVSGGLQLSTDAVRELFRSGGVDLRLRGEPVAWHGVDDGAAIRFVAPEVGSPFSRYHRYLLSVGNGVVMNSRALLGGASAAPHRFIETKHFEENVFPGPTGGPDPRLDLFFWHGLSSEAQVTISLSLPGLVDGEAKELRVLVHGATLHPGQPHRVELLWNGQSLGVFDLYGRQRHTIVVSLEDVAADLENELVVQQHVAGEAPPSLYVDSVEVDYLRLAEADMPQFVFGGAEDGQQSVHGLSSETVLLYEISDAAKPTYYGELTLAEPGAMSFTESGESLRFLVTDSESVLTPVEIRPRFASELRSRGQGADYVIVSASHLFEDARLLAEYRESDGYRVSIVDIEDVYWEFADGEPDPLAVRDFLRFASLSWGTAPRFAVLLGGGSLDYRDLLGFGGNWIPPALAATDGGLFPSDSLLADLVGDDALPDIAIGRLPFSTGDELETFLTSVREFEDTHESMAVLTAADDSERGEFSEAARNLGGWTAPERLREIDLNAERLEEARARLFSFWDEPMSWVSYVGHGGLDRMANEGLLTTEDVASLAALGSSPLVVAWSCNLLRFDIPGFSAIGEDLLDAGAVVGVFSSTGWSNHFDTDAMRTAFAKSAFASEAETLGEVMLRGHQAAAGAERQLHRVYMLLGDPALRLRAAKTEPPPDPEPKPEPEPEPSGEPNPPLLQTDPGPGLGSGCEIRPLGDSSGLLGRALLLLGLVLMIRRRRA
jgi:hypothetical protein